MTRNHLIVIGNTGDSRAYLNISRDEAVRRFRLSEGWDPEADAGKHIAEFDFVDEFWAYDVGPLDEARSDR